MLNDDNPYASPTDSLPGEYDWTLAKRMLLMFLMIAIVYLLAGAIGAWQAFRYGTNDHRNQPLSEAIIDFATDWKSSDSP